MQWYASFFRIVSCLLSQVVIVIQTSMTVQATHVLMVVIVQIKWMATAAYVLWVLLVTDVR
jgi:hypothetical protein